MPSLSWAFFLVAGADLPVGGPEGRAELSDKFDFAIAVALTTAHELPARAIKFLRLSVYFNDFMNDSFVKTPA